MHDENDVIDGLDSVTRAGLPALMEMVVGNNTTDETLGDRAKTSLACFRHATGRYNAKTARVAAVLKVAKTLRKPPESLEGLWDQIAPPASTRAVRAITPAESAPVGLVQPGARKGGIKS